MTEYDKRHRLCPRPSTRGDRWKERLQGSIFQRQFDAR